MSDPERLSRKPSNATVAALLRAGAHERPSERAIRRTLKAVGAGAGLAAAAATAKASGALATGAKASVLAAAEVSSAATVSSLAAAAVVKWVGVGAVTGLVFASATHQIARVAAPSDARVETRPVERARASSPHTVPGSARSPSSSAGHAAPSPVGAVDLAGTSEARKDGAHALPSEGRLAPSVVGSASRGLLAAEVAFVDAAGTALRSGDPRATLAKLQAYETRFPRQQLLTEVLSLRMEATSQLGDSASARALARRLLERGVAGPLAARARQALEE